MDVYDRQMDMEEHPETIIPIPHPTIVWQGIKTWYKQTYALKTHIFQIC